MDAENRRTLRSQPDPTTCQLCPLGKFYNDPVPQFPRLLNEGSSRPILLRAMLESSLQITGRGAKAPQTLYFCHHHLS